MVEKPTRNQKIHKFWEATPRNTVDIFKYFVGSSYIYLHDTNVCNNLTIDTVSHPKMTIKVKLRYEDIWGNGGIIPPFLASLLDGEW
jgi:hypothetical protein